MDLDSICRLSFRYTTARYLLAFDICMTDVLIGTFASR